MRLIFCKGRNIPFLCDEKNALLSCVNVNKTDKMTYFYNYHKMALTLYF